MYLYGPHNPFCISANTQTYPMFEQWQGYAFWPRFKSFRNTELGIPTVYLVDGFARSAIDVFAGIKTVPEMSRERF